MNVVSDGPAHMDLHASEINGPRPVVSLVFISDDEHLVQRIASQFPQEVSIVVAHSAELATQMVQQRDVDLIVIDNQFCGMQGTSLCQSFKQTTRLASVPIIIIAPKRDKVEEEEALTVGAADYFESDLSTMSFYLRLKRHIEHIQQIRDLERASREDGLTGLANRRQLEEDINKEWHGAIRGEDPITFLFVDVDQFKLYNDHYGYLSGDECLRQVTLALEKAVSRAEDTIARYDGEEFLVILPRTDRDGGEGVASQLVDEIANLRLKHAPNADCDTLTVTIGGTTFQPGKQQAGTSIEQVVAQARRSLAQAKQVSRGAYWVD